MDDYVAGGPGTDTFRLLVDDGTIDLTAIADSRLVDIEVIDLTGFGDNTLVLTQLEVLNLSSTSNSLTVLRDSSDIVEMGEGWELVDRGTDLWQSLEVYEQGEARVTLQGTLPEIDILSAESRGFRILGPEGSLTFGGDIRSVPDLNADGYTEFMFSRSVGGITNLYVVFGAADGFPNILDVTTDLDGSNGFLIRMGEHSLTDANRNVDAGDFNGDGISDLMLPTNNRLFVIFGSASGFPASLHVVSELDGTNGVNFSKGDADWYSAASPQRLVILMEMVLPISF